jgi:ATP-dependent helicase/nuclease subunit A
MFQVLHSSAGAGKTHALVKYYLGHCLRGDDPAAYRQVLALTFTNKAAAEMKQRVLHYLDDLAAARTDDARIADLMDHLVVRSGAGPDVIAQRADRCLRHMLHHWEHVAISTIDAFTRKVVRPFARDLQLDHDLRMTTEQDHYLQRAVDAVIAEAGVDPQLTRLLSEACTQLLIDERKWEPGIPLRELSGELVKESSIAPLRALAGLSADEVTALAARLRAQEAAFRDQVQAIGREAMALLQRHGITVDDVAHGKSGYFGYFRKLQEFADAWDPPGANTLKPMSTGKWWSAKASPSAIAALESIGGQLKALFDRAEDLRENGLRDHLVRRAVGRELLPAFALHEMDLRLEVIKQADGVAFFSDLTRKVAEVVKDEPVPFIYERLGERFRHFLIDEFQDTSLLQWQALLPLIDNALSTGGSTLLVGDAKQAIYRWRNGEVRLFTSFPRIFGNGDSSADQDRERTLQRTYTPIEPLAFNRRSAAGIVRFNNALFDELKGHLAPELLAVYEGHAQRVAREAEGLVHVAVLPAEVKGDERREATLAFALDRVREALADGFAPGDIAVLVRGRRLGAPVAEHLMAHGIDVVSPDGLLLGGDPAVELVIDLLRCIRKNDPAAAARVLQYQAMLRADAEAAEVALDLADRDPLATVLDRLRATGHGQLRTTLTALADALARANDLSPATDATLLTLFDEMHAWTTDHGQDIGGFLAHWERVGVGRSVSPPDDGRAVQVLTVHKSKGLQFPVVIVPDVGMSARGNFGERFWVRPGAAVPELPVALVREGKGLQQAALPELEEESGLRTLDALNLLYVAFTRPEQRLYALASPDRADAITKGLIAHVAAHGEGDRLVRGERVGPWSVRRTVEGAQLVDVAGEGAARPTLRIDVPDEWDPADPDPFRSFGEAVHAVLGATTTPDTLPAAVQAAVAAGTIKASDAAALERRLAALLAAPDVAPWFAADGQVRTEAVLIMPCGPTAWW